MLVAIQVRFSAAGSFPATGGTYQASLFLSPALPASSVSSSTILLIERALPGGSVHCTPRRNTCVNSAQASSFDQSKGNSPAIDKLWN